jgi:hypothetical protein
MKTQRLNFLNSPVSGPWSRVANRKSGGVPAMEGEMSKLLQLLRGGKTSPLLAALLILAAVGPLAGQQADFGKRVPGTGNAPPFAALPPGNLGNPPIAPPQSQFFGQTYSEWSAAWFRWVYSLPSTAHPLLDTAECSAGQTGDVWFIGGTRGPNPFPPLGRNCTIPAGTALFLALAANQWDNEACGASGIQRTTFTESQLRMFAYNNLNGFLGSRGIEIDGVDVQGLPACDPSNPSTCQSPYRVQSPVYNYTVPAFDNLLILDDGACYNNPSGTGAPYTALGAVADGVYVMIKPLPVGQHTIRFGPLPALSRLYHITVTP